MYILFDVYSRPSRGNNALTPMASSSSNLSETVDRARSAATMASSQGGSSEVLDNVARPPIWCRNRSPKPGSTTPRLLQADTGRTIEQVYTLIHFFLEVF